MLFSWWYVIFKTLRSLLTIIVSNLCLYVWLKICEHSWSFVTILVKSCFYELVGVVFCLLYHIKSCRLLNPNMIGYHILVTGDEKTWRIAFGTDNFSYIFDKFGFCGLHVTFELLLSISLQIPKFNIYIEIHTLFSGNLYNIIKDVSHVFINI